MLLSQTGKRRDEEAAISSGQAEAEREQSLHGLTSFAGAYIVSGLIANLSPERGVKIQTKFTCF
jgi:hypothetical protein